MTEGFLISDKMLGKSKVLNGESNPLVTIEPAMSSFIEKKQE